MHKVKTKDDLKSASKILKDAAKLYATEKLDWYQGALNKYENGKIAACCLLGVVDYSGWPSGMSLNKDKKLQKLEDKQIDQHSLAKEYLELCCPEDASIVGVNDDLLTSKQEAYDLLVLAANVAESEGN